jgi:F-type H+-transporting ATPase subunit c
MEYLYYIAIGIMMVSASANAIGEANICMHAIDNMGRNPEMYGKLRTAMILGCALVETTAIYCLLVSILLIFVR